MAALKGVLQQPLYVIRKIPSDCISMLKEHIIGFRHVQSRLPDEPRSCCKVVAGLQSTSYDYQAYFGY